MKKIVALLLCFTLIFSLFGTYKIETRLYPTYDTDGNVTYVERDFKRFYTVSNALSFSEYVGINVGSLIYLWTYLFKENFDKINPSLLPTDNNSLIANVGAYLADSILVVFSVLSVLILCILDTVIWVVNLFNICFSYLLGLELDFFPYIDLDGFISPEDVWGEFIVL